MLRHRRCGEVAVAIFSLKHFSLFRPEDRFTALVCGAGACTVYQNTAALSPNYFTLHIPLSNNFKLQSKQYIIYNFTNKRTRTHTHIYIYIYIYIHIGFTQKNGAVSKLNNKFISHLTRTQCTPSAAANVQVSHVMVCLLHFEQFVSLDFAFRPRHSKRLQLARLVKRIARNFGKKRLAGAVFLDVIKAFSTVWTDSLIYKLTLLNFPSYIVHTISSYLMDRTYEESFQRATSSLRGMQAGVAKGGLISSVLFSLYVNDMPPPSHHVELALYADDTAIIATSRKRTLFVNYLESYLNDLQQLLSEWRIAINVSKSTAITSRVLDGALSSPEQ